MPRRPAHLGSFVLLVLAATVIVRPWEDLPRLLGEDPPRSAWAYVIRAVDGDTIEVRVGGRVEDVRYIGVDTPETVKPGTPVQCFGPRAHRFDARLVAHRRVRLVFDAERRDVYDRLLAYVYLQGRFVNAELVRRGLARTLTIPPNDSFASRFKRLEMAAARAGLGLWGAC
ncbi:MAG TPA: thermonuclease family protein [Solirubrobacterales bacterium]|nr:thermonuclease family protein [Solirubrobacterales bacterium]